jgi:carboxymethylenebutenolidase
MGDMISLTSVFDGATFGAYHVEPAAGLHRRGGVIVIQEVFGVDRYVRADVERWAGLGFEALGPSMFDRIEAGYVGEHSPEGFPKAISMMQGTPWDQAVADIETCVNILSERGPVFVLGYCYGGSLSYLSACKLAGLSAASCYYGSLLPSHAADAPLCPTIAHFGRLDQYIPLDGVEAFSAARPEVATYLYDAGHGFNNEGGQAYSADSAQLARQRTLQLFEQNGAL